MPPPNAIVIGTGFGGAVVACRLAQAGFAVTVLERGRRYDREPSGYPRGVFDEWLWGSRRGLFDIRPTQEMQIVQAAGYGGGSLIYANVHLRPPPEVFATGWPAGYSREALDPYYDVVAQMLDIRPITDSPRGMPTKTTRMTDAATGLGRQDAFFYPPLAVNFSSDASPKPNRFGAMQAGCTHCGECIIGCQNRAKNTLDRNYLALAESLGATMRTECEVSTIVPLADGASGYRVHFRDHSTETETFADAAHVFVCAGAVNSTALLLQSKAAGGLPNLSLRLGHGYSGNGDLLAFAFDTGSPWRPDGGPTITTALCYASEGPETGGWFVIEEGGYPAILAPLIDLSRPSHLWQAGSGGPVVFVGEEGPPRPADISDAFRQTAEQTLGQPTPPVFSPDTMANTAMFLAMGRDLANGRIELLPDNTLSVRWDAASNLPLYNLQERLVADLAGQLQGTYAPEAFWRFARLPISVHNLGGCGMSDSPAEGVTSGEGEVFGYPNLFVMDGAILPAATGVNPSHTIAAVAERNIARFLARVATFEVLRKEPVPPYADPLSQLRLPACGTPPPCKPALGLSFHERLVGSWGPNGEQAASYSLTITVNDIAAFIQDEAHVAIASGTVDIAGLTDGPAEVRGGIWNALILQSDAERTVRYLLPFRAADGRPCALSGTKRFRPHPGTGLWNENTEMPFTLHADFDGRGEPLGDGTLRIGPAGILDLAASFRVFGPYGSLEKARALSDFLRFYLGTVAEVSWG